MELPAITGLTHIDGRTQSGPGGMGTVRVGVLSNSGARIFNGITFGPGSAGSSTSGMVIRNFFGNQIFVVNGTGANLITAKTYIYDSESD